MKSGNELVWGCILDVTGADGWGRVTNEKLSSVNKGPCHLLENLVLGRQGMIVTMNAKYYIEDHIKSC